MKVDVCINVYGKPWSTLVTLKSLMYYSGEHIDKIYFIEEKQQPYNDDVKMVLDHFDNIIHFTPYKYEFLPRINMSHDYRDEILRYGFRYQYGIEKSDKKFLFITHNDIRYTGDIIGDMLMQIGDAAGIGSIGQCWNCPANNAGECDGDRFESYNPTYEHFIKLCNDYPPARGQYFKSLINPNSPMPLPECRLNEFACLINREITMKECIPNGNTCFFGDYSGIDVASSWFRSLVIKGYKFKHYNIENSLIHGYENRNHSGNSTLTNEEFYRLDEDKAKKFYEENKCIANRVISSNDRTIVIATNNGKSNLQELLNSLEKIQIDYNIAIIDTQSTNLESIEFINKLDSENPYNLNIKVFRTPHKGYDTGAYIYAINNIDSKYFYFLQDSMQIKSIDFFNETNKRLNNNNSVVPLLTFPSNFFDNEEERQFCINNFGTLESKAGIFGPMFAISKENINLIDKKYLVYPSNKTEQMAMERGWGIIFNKYVISIIPLEGTHNDQMLRNDGYKYFKKTFRGRL